MGVVGFLLGVPALSSVGEGGGGGDGEALRVVQNGDPVINGVGNQVVFTPPE